MSEPIRYRPDWTYTGTAFVPFCRQQDNGEFIRYEDYAELKAEVERLNWIVNFVYANNSDIFDEAFEAWNAAKEGKP